MRVAGDLFLALEQLEAIRELLRTKSSVRARMALILLDGLADSLLFRRLERIYEASEEPWLRGEMPVFPSRERSLARQRFNRRVEIARRPTELDRWVGDGAPLIDDADAAVLKVGHSYRNGAYHQGVHNEYVIASVARVLFGAVARLAARMQRPGLSVGPTSAADIDQLARWGYETGSMLDICAAADSVVGGFITELEIDANELRELLADDLESRVDSLRRDIGFLEENGTMEPANVIKGIELWWHYRADEELLELEQQADPFRLARESGLGEPTEQLVDQTRRALIRYRERMDELESAHKQRVSLDLVKRATRVAGRLRRLGDSSRILVTYHEVDEPLTELERYVDHAVMVLDREIQLQIDIRRGK